MHITVKWFDGKYPSFNLSLHSKEGADEFLTVKGCRIARGKDGDFLAYPSTKGNNDKYWNHAWGSDKFNAEVLKIAQASKPRDNQGSNQKPNQNDYEPDIPF